jgi:kynureninase
VTGIVSGSRAPTRADALRLDEADPLGRYREEFVDGADDVDGRRIYLDGNSLGRQPRAAAVAVETRLAEWREQLVGGWHTWIDLPEAIGDRLGTGVLGARAGEVLVADSTTVNLYKLAAAALDARPGRSVVLSSADEFPTDRYVLQGLCAARGLTLRDAAADLDAGVGVAGVRDALDESVALVVLSHVAYRSGALADLPAITAAAHEVGALVLWDLSHSGGSVQAGLSAAGADLAVGCTYKYLNGGPGAPAYLYVRTGLQEELRQPIWGWFGAADQFAMGERYVPAPGIDRFLVGTPPVLSLVGAEEGVRLLAEAGIDRLRAKGMAMTSYLVELADAWLAPLGFRLASPRDPARRGAHISLEHPAAWQVCQALLDRGVVPDYRTPDRLRLGPAPLTTRFTEVHDAMAVIRDLVAAGTHRDYPEEIARVT